MKTDRNIFASVESLHSAFVKHCNECDCPMGCILRKDTRNLLDTNCASILMCFAQFVVNHKKECGKCRSQRKYKWLNGKNFEYDFAYCSKCGHMQYAGWDTHLDAREKIADFHNEYQYCPSCGAMMEGGEYIE